MVGVIIITHGDFGEKLLESAQNIIGTQRLVAAISISYAESPAVVKEKLEKQLMSSNLADGWLVLTDMVGGTPCNVCMTFVEKLKDKLAVISGVNMYMLLSVFTHREMLNLTELKNKVIEDAQASIMDVKEKFLKLHPNKCTE
ncbi:MAG: hypothetical protein AB1349_03225 [Elusimicrobiota bacterium]